MKAFDKVKEFVCDHDYEIASGIFYGIMIGSTAYIVYQTGKADGLAKGFTVGGTAIETLFETYEPEAYNRVLKMVKTTADVAKAVKL